MHSDVYIRGVVESVDREAGHLTLGVADGAGQAAADIDGPWRELLSALAPGTEVGLEGREVARGAVAVDGAGFVVLEPSHYVPVSAIRRWADCPRLHHLDTRQQSDLSYPMILGTIVHEVFGELLREQPTEAAIDRQVTAQSVALAMLDKPRAEVRAEVADHTRGIEHWLAQQRIDGADDWRSEVTLTSPRYGLRGRADAIRNGVPVELKTGRNTAREARMKDKLQATAYALMLTEQGMHPDSATVLYSKNAVVADDADAGVRAAAREFPLTSHLRQYVIQLRNALVAARLAGEPPTGFDGQLPCARCFERDHCMVIAARLDERSKAGRIGEPLPAPVRAHLQTLTAAIEQERAAVHARIDALWRSPTTADESDRSLRGLRPIDRRRRSDGRWELTASAPDATISRLRVGDLALASGGDPRSDGAEVVRILALRPAVVVRADEPIELRRLDALSTESGIDRMIRSVHDFYLRGPDHLAAVLTGQAAPRFAPLGAEEHIPTNADQDAAVRLALAARDCAFVHGPPGTGKTYTLARIVAALVDRGDRVLISALTNRAVDTAVTALRDVGVEDIARVGSPYGVGAAVADLHIDREGGPDEARRLREASVIAATTASAASRLLQTQQVDTVVIDEASQLTEPAALAAIVHGQRFILVGDHRQLPPVVRADTALRTSLFERLIERYPDAGQMLTAQYRMAQRIQAFSSEEFYDGRLRPADASVAAQDPAALFDRPEAVDPALQRRVRVVDPGGTQDGNRNPVEAEAVAQLVAAYEAAGVDPDAIGVIAPYRAQVETIAALTDVTVDTVDRFQGSAREVIIISLTATGDLTEPLFADHRRMNVALTRARRALVIVGSKQTMQQDPFYARLLRWADH
jgi:Superfamily I DNA and RNA helicases and helicase subunits